MNRVVAEKINSLFLKQLKEQQEAILLVKENCQREMLDKFLEPVSQIVALNFDILDIVHAEYPDLRPKEWGQDSKGT